MDKSSSGQFNINLNNSADKIVLKVGGPPDRSPPTTPVKSAVEEKDGGSNRGSVYMNVPGHMSPETVQNRTASEVQNRTASDVQNRTVSEQIDVLHADGQVQDPAHLHQYVNISQDLVKSKFFFSFLVFMYVVIFLRLLFNMFLLCFACTFLSSAIFLFHVYIICIFL